VRGHLHDCVAWDIHIACHQTLSWRLSRETRRDQWVQPDRLGDDSVEVHELAQSLEVRRRAASGGVGIVDFALELPEDLGARGKMEE